MSRYRGPKLRITRRLGILPGLTTKESKKVSRPGQHGKANADNNKKTTEYGVRLEEKQKLKFNYGLTESQLYRYIKEARRRKGVTGLILLQLLYFNNNIHRKCYLFKHDNNDWICYSIYTSTYTRNKLLYYRCTCEYIWSRRTVHI